MTYVCLEQVAREVMNGKVVKSNVNTTSNTHINSLVSNRYINSLRYVQMVHECGCESLRG